MSEPEHVGSISSLRNLRRAIGEIITVVGSVSAADEGAGIGVWQVTRGTYTSGDDDGTNTVFPRMSDGTYAWERISALVPPPAASAADAGKVLAVASGGATAEWTNTPTFGNTTVAGTLTTTLHTSASQTSTITDGAVTVTAGVILLSPETGTTDDLDTLDDGDALPVGTRLILRMPNSSHTITIRTGEDNIVTMTGVDCVLEVGSQAVEVVKTYSTTWTVMNNPDSSFGDLTATRIVSPRVNALTIASGVISVTRSVHGVLNEGGAGTDDLVTINGGVTGQFLLLRPFNSGQDFSLLNTGNVNFAGTSITPQTTDDLVLLWAEGSEWYVVSASPGCVIV